jgi:hypothetical protein
MAMLGWLSLERVRASLRKRFRVAGSVVSAAAAVLAQHPGPDAHHGPDKRLPFPQHRPAPGRDSEIWSGQPPGEGLHPCVMLRSTQRGKRRHFQRVLCRLSEEEPGAMWMAPAASELGSRT